MSTLCDCSMTVAGVCSEGQVRGRGEGEGMGGLVAGVTGDEGVVEIGREGVGLRGEGEGVLWGAKSEVWVVLIP